ncbi:MAG: hypothetical protein RJA49_2338 [Actinomycetota bacterium]
MTAAVRDDLLDAHRASLAHVVAPGARFNGEVRRRIAEVAIAAYLDPEPSPPWVRPYGEPALDLAYRLARHAGTITAEWYEQLVTEGLHPVEWVEVVGVVVAALPPVAFARAIGAPLPELPEAVAGPPTGHEADELAPARLNFVPVAAPADRMPSVVQALSALPDEWHNLWRLADAQYMSDRAMDDPRWTRGTLSRPQMELVAGRLSLIRECFF